MFKGKGRWVWAAALWLGAAACGGVRAPKETAAPAPATYRYQAADIEIIHCPVANGIVAAEWILTGGGAADQVEATAVAGALKCGAGYLAPDDVAAKWDGYGTQVACSTGVDASFISLVTIEKYFYNSFEIGLEILLRPRFERRAFQTLKENQAAAVLESAARPLERACLCGAPAYFAEYPRAPRPEGTYERLTATTPDSAAAYFRRMITRKNLKLVIVGEIDVAWLLDKMRVAFAETPVGETPPRRKNYRPAETAEFVAETDTTDKGASVCGSRPLFDLNAKDYAAIEVLFIYLERDLKREFVYRRYVVQELSLELSPTAGGTALFRCVTDFPAATFPTMARYWADFATYRWTEEELAPLRAALLLRYYRLQETNAGFAAYLSNSICIDGGVNARAYPAAIQALKGVDLSRAFRLYGKGWRWAFVAPPNKLKACAPLW